jgi:hypothetical protein
VVAWGGIEKSAARRATTHFSDSSYLLGTPWGTPKLGYGGGNSWHHTTDMGAAELHYPPFAAARQSANRVRMLINEARHRSAANWLCGENLPTPMDAIASAIRLLTDSGYVVLKAPTWSEHVPLEPVRAAPVSARAPTFAAGSHAQGTNWA